MCSRHFQGGKKMGQVDEPAIFPLLPQPMREPLPKPAKSIPTAIPTAMSLAGVLVASSFGT